MQWIRTNTPTDARFLVNSFPAYGGYLLVGSDAGWWVQLLAHRQSTLPPLTYGSEKSESPTFTNDTNQLWEKLRGKSLMDFGAVSIDLTTPDAIKLLRDARATYIYIGANNVPASELVDHINTQKLSSNPAFKRVYSQDGVEIFQLL
jgi:hypothetical protein